MLKVIVVGLGPIGMSCAKAVRADPSMKLIGLVDLDPQKLDKTLEELLGETQSKRRSVRVVNQIALAAKGADLAIVATTSHFDQIVPTLRQCMKHRLYVVSSCEEMSFPNFRHKKLANQIDREAKKAKVALLGTGVNPGFVMDLLPLVLSS
ncbi:MAG TPA: hypothetical protein VKK61_11865, partial [Tepidisphaeraceae bacterium]|nr:hypothetical protein [Tepidisphaeraceae bacterium]